MPTLRILVIEDEPKVARALQQGLEDESYGVTLAQTGEEGYFLLTSQRYDLAIIDVMLPGRDGFEILEAVRRQGCRTPAIMLTARDALEDRVRGLDLGADDYLVKPFAFPELSARVRALLRRSQPQPPALLSLLDLEIDPVARCGRRGGKPLDLTPREYELLEYLLRHQGRIVSREMLTRDIWKEPVRHTPLDNVIDVHMVRLRRKVDEGCAVRLLHTVRGVGFTLKAGHP
ncbi:MAG: response regulator transcription factor [Bryobacteraceae bacterium]|nr:response regulator transcription factor [Bryobacteraceae bacterium]